MSLRLYVPHKKSLVSKHVFARLVEDTKDLQKLNGGYYAYRMKYISQY